MQSLSETRAWRTFLWYQSGSQSRKMCPFSGQPVGSQPHPRGRAVWDPFPLTPMVVWRCHSPSGLLCPRGDSATCEGSPLFVPKKPWRSFPATWLLVPTRRPSESGPWGSHGCSEFTYPALPRASAPGPCTLSPGPKAVLFLSHSRRGLSLCPQGLQSRPDAETLTPFVVILASQPRLICPLANFYSYQEAQLSNISIVEEILALH